MHHPSTSPRRGTFARVCTVGALAIALVLPATAANAAAIPDYLTDPDAAPGTYSEQNIGADRTASNFFYRIPALAHLGDGVVLAAWDARPGSAADSPNPNSIIQRRSTDNGQTWSDLQIIAAGQTGAPKHGYSDPSYVVDQETGAVFAFFVYSKDQGFWGSVYGADAENRQVTNTVVIRSDDQGVTWSEPRLINDVAKTSNGTTVDGVYTPVAGDVRGSFASSGEGIQLKYGEYAGRLIQQYAGEILQADGSTKIQAYSVYSDDHGETWQRGEYVGAGMDENKVVELSDGSVMLNSRDNWGGKQRKIAISTDGGVTYGEVTKDAELPDPTNNASITRLHPDAAEGSADAKKLLFTNSNSTSARANGGVRLSCDDGQTWPGLRTIETGTFGYSTATAIDDDRIGVLWEAGYTNTMHFSSFDEAWLNAVCAPLSVPAATLEPTVATSVPVTVTNQEDTALTGTVSFLVGSGWTASDAQVTDLAPGASVTVDVEVTAPAGSSNTQTLQAAFTASDGRISQTTATFTLPRESILGATLSVTNTSAARDVAANPYRVGDVLTFQTRVVSTSNETTIVTPADNTFTAGFAPTACRWQKLPAYDAYNCKTPTRTLTQEDIDRGWYTPEFSFTVAPVDGSVDPVTVSHTGAPVLLRADTLGAAITGGRTDTGRDLSADPYAVGDQVPYSFRVDSTSPVTVAVVPTAGSFAPFLPEGAGNCRYKSLPVGEGYTCATPRHAVTQDDIDRGYFVADTTWSVQATGQTSKEIAVAGGEVDVIARNPHLTVAVEGVWTDANGDGLAAAGDTVTWTRTLVNDGNVVLDAVTVDGVDVGALAAGDTLALDAVVITLTASDATAGTLAPTAVEASAVNGAKDAVVEVSADAVDLPGAPAWKSSTFYRPGDRVVYKGVLYQAKAWTLAWQPGSLVWISPWKVVS